MKKTFFEYTQVQDIISPVLLHEWGGAGSGGGGGGGSGPSPGPGRGPIIDSDMLPPDIDLPVLDGSDEADPDAEIESIDAIIRKVNEEAKKRGDKGPINRVSEETLNRLGVTRKNWRQLLEQMLQRFKVPDLPTRVRLGRGGQLAQQQGMAARPGVVQRKVDKMGHIMIAVDTSGSMTPAILAQIVSVVEDLTKDINSYPALGIIRIIYYSHHVWNHQDYDTKGAKTKISTDIEMTAGRVAGGNSWVVIMDELFKTSSYTNVLKKQELEDQGTDDASATGAAQTGFNAAIKNTDMSGYIFITDGGEYADMTTAYTPSTAPGVRPGTPFALALTHTVNDTNIEFIETLKEVDKGMTTVELNFTRS